MKKIIPSALISLLAASALVAGIASAHEGMGDSCPGNLVDSNGHVVLDSAGQCVKNASWSTENACKECNPELFPEPMAEAAPPTPAPPPKPAYQKVTLSATTLFDFDKSNLKPAGETALRELSNDIKAKGGQVIDIDVVGYTDSVGTEEYNMQLSIRRATTVKDFLVSEGIDPAIIDVIGKGEADPVATNATAEGRAENRRVEVTVGMNAPT
jgi:OOP family OmpA-OmpF porin